MESEIDTSPLLSESMEQSLNNYNPTSFTGNRKKEAISEYFGVLKRRIKEKKLDVRVKTLRDDEPTADRVLNEILDFFSEQNVSATKRRDSFEGVNCLFSDCPLAVQYQVPRKARQLKESITYKTSKGGVWKHYAGKQLDNLVSKRVRSAPSTSKVAEQEPHDAATHETAALNPMSSPQTSDMLLSDLIEKNRSILENIGEKSKGRGARTHLPVKAVLNSLPALKICVKNIYVDTLKKSPYTAEDTAKTIIDFCFNVLDETTSPLNDTQIQNYFKGVSILLSDSSISVKCDRRLAHAQYKTSFDANWKNYGTKQHGRSPKERDEDSLNEPTKAPIPGKGKALDGDADEKPDVGDLPVRLTQKASPATVVGGGEPSGVSIPLIASSRAKPAGSSSEPPIQERIDLGELQRQFASVEGETKVAFGWKFANAARMADEPFREIMAATYLVNNGLQNKHNDANSKSRLRYQGSRLIDLGRRRERLASEALGQYAILKFGDGNAQLEAAVELKKLAENSNVVSPERLSEADTILKKNTEDQSYRYVPPPLRGKSTQPEALRSLEDLGRTRPNQEGSSLPEPPRSRSPENFQRR